MSKLWQLIGQVVFWLSWPALFIYIRGSRRTRVLLVHNDKALLVKNWMGRGKWALPGGGAHAGESMVEALVREVREELGIMLSTGDCVSYGLRTFAKRRLHFEYELYMVELGELPTLKLQWLEIADAQWFTRTEIETWVHQSPEVSEALLIWKP